jgi:hypothetical protein
VPCAGCWPGARTGRRRCAVEASVQVVRRHGTGLVIAGHAGALGTAVAVAAEQGRRGSRGLETVWVSRQPKPVNGRLTYMKQYWIAILALMAGAVLVGCGDSPHGTIAGKLVRVGGPAPSSSVSLPGRVVAIGSAGKRFTVSVHSDGQFKMLLPPGEYRLEGYSPRALSNGNEVRCFREKQVHVVSGSHSRDLKVICSIH